MLEILKAFRIGRPQVIAGSMLAGLMMQSLVMAWQLPMTGAEFNTIRESAELALGHSVWREAQAPPSAPQDKLHDSILITRILGAVFPEWGASPEQFAGSDSSSHSPRALVFRMRLPFVVFGLWLGGALWWVTRRLFDNAGGYAALALYCFSPNIQVLSSTVNAEIVAAWGLFGMVYTAIGVAHTLYAPPRKWTLRILLLGTAFGITAAAHLAAAFIGFIFAAGFLLYLAPGRRMASCGILALSSLLGVFELRMLYGLQGMWLTQLDWMNAMPRNFSRLTEIRGFLISENLTVVFLFVISLLAFLLWRRARYFGNWTPLLVAAVLLSLGTAQGNPMLWGLPFVFVFIGGMVADLLESQYRLAAFLTTSPLISAQALLSLLRVFGTG